MSDSDDDAVIRFGGPDADFARYGARDPLAVMLMRRRSEFRAPRRLPRLHLPSRTEPVPQPEPESPPEALAQHWIEFRFLDATGRPIVDVPYRIDLPDGSEQKGRLDAQGSARYAPQPEGSGTIRLADIESASWGASAIEAHESAELAVQTTGIDPGESVRFAVFRLYRERPGDEVTTLDGTLDDAGRASATWTPPDPGQFPGDQFVFRATVGGASRTSAALEVRHYEVSAEWSQETARDGDQVSLRAHLCGVRDGESAALKILEKRWRDKQDGELGQLQASVAGGAIEVSWSIPPAGEPPARGDDGRRDLYYTVEAGGLLCASTLLAVFPAEEAR